MSRHEFNSRWEEFEVRVVGGYDRPLNNFFLNIYTQLPSEHEPEFSSLDDRDFDWTRFESLGEKLAELDIDCPPTFLAEIKKDQQLQVGNRITEHFFNKEPYDRL